MEFNLSGEQKMLQKELTHFCRKDIAPIVDEYDTAKILLDPEVLKALLEKLSIFGLLSGPISESFGGSGLGFLTTGLVHQILAKYYSSLQGICTIQVCSARVLQDSENEYVINRYLADLCLGKKIICSCITEPNVGSNPLFIETTLGRTKDGLVLNGSKTWISNGSVSDVAIVVAKAGKSLGEGLAVILVDREESPYQTNEISKLGLNSFPTSEVYFDNVLVPEENLLVKPGQGLKAILKGFEMARSMMAIGAAGLAEAAIELAVSYAKSREQSGKKIGSFQLIQQMIADMKARTEASRLLTYQALWLMDEERRCDSESSLAKFYSTEAAVKTASECIQILGAYGLSTECPAERYFRDARCLTIPDGTTQIQKMIVARSLTGLNAF